MATLGKILEGRATTLADVGSHLGRLAGPERLAETLALGKGQQSRLWDLAESASPLALDYLVPEGAPPLVPFPFEGRNSLPAFTRFRKVFYRTPDGGIAGYNDQALSPITGPGYMLVRLEGSHPGEIAIDYRRVPSCRPAGWPAIRPNEAGLSRFIYGGMVDYLRRVTEDVVIGRAYRDGTKAMANWFVLVRWRSRD